jgi:hypothetical protein
LNQIGPAQGGKAQEYADISRLPDAGMGQSGQILSDVKMASISNGNTLAKTPGLSGAYFRPICSPF